MNESIDKTKLQPRKIMHTMIRVGDLTRSLEFYVDRLGMKQMRRADFPQGRFSIVMVGYGTEEDTAVLELTHNWDTPTYELGGGYGHLALATTDIYGLCGRLANEGVKVVRPPGPMKGGPTIAFLEDPDGYRVELIEVDDAHPLGRYGDAKP
jgi:lactoylglutathione lyase